MVVRPPDYSRAYAPIATPVRAAAAVCAPEEVEQLRSRVHLVREHARTVIASLAPMRVLDLPRLGAADALIALPSASRDEMRAAVGEYTLLLRQLGEAPEKALIEVKKMVGEAACASDGRPDLVMPVIVRWAIEAYYSP